MILATLACQAAILASFAQAKENALQAYPQHAEQIHAIKAALASVPDGFNAQVVYGGAKPKLPKSWGYVPVDYIHRVTYDADKLCALPEDERNRIVRHEIGHVLAHLDKADTVNEEAMADAYGATLEAP